MKHDLQSLVLSSLLNSFPQPSTPHRSLLDTKEMVRAARVTVTDIATAETATVATPMTIGAETTAAGEGAGTKTTTTVTTTATTTTATGPATTTTQPSTTTTIATGSEITTVSETTTSTLSTVGEEGVGVGEEEDWMEGDAAGALDEITTVPRIGQGERRHLQWNLRTRDTMRPMILSLVERSSLSRRSNNTLKYISMGLKQVSFVERSSLSRRVPYWRFHCKLHCGLSQLCNIWVGIKKFENLDISSP